MTDSSDDESLSFGEWIPYGARSNWTDIEPIEQDDGPKDVVAIAYSPKFRDIYNYMRAIMAKNEKSPRALELTADALRLNPANYTVWQYRREILRELRSDLLIELNFLRTVIERNAKNYQVWHHRRTIVEMMNGGDFDREQDLTEDALEADAKNYHAWQYRQWVIRYFNCYDRELAFVDRLLNQDQRNNSAWNQRFFVVKHYGFTPETIEREIQYTINRIKVIKNNESAWNYLVGVLRQSADGKLSSSQEAINFSEELHNRGIRSPYLLAFLIDLYQEQCFEHANIITRTALATKVFGLCEDMTKKYDIIRRKYWEYVADSFKTKLNKLKLI